MREIIIGEFERTRLIARKSSEQMSEEELQAAMLASLLNRY
jgi:hypothetical protein